MTHDNTVQHFAINADNPDRARAFYESVFNWKISAWGPPGFFLIETHEGGIRGALQQRRNVVPDRPIHGFECTIAVPDLGAAQEAIVAQGGRIVMERSTIQGVGDLLFFEDTEGNIAGAMQYVR